MSKLKKQKPSVLGYIEQRERGKSQDLTGKKMKVKKIKRSRMN